MSLRPLIVMTLALGLAACAEQPQTATVKKVDGKPWDVAQNVYHADGWKAGDQASWENQLRSRAQGQNEYSRAAP